MVKKYPEVWFVFLAVFLALTIIPQTVFAGRTAVGERAVHSPRTPVDAQLGVRFASQLPNNLKAGDKIQAVVLNPEKLAALGFSGLKRGDKITLVQEAQENTFSVKTRTKQRLLKIGANGVVAPH